jgi:hypothetical protein
MTRGGQAGKPYVALFVRKDIPTGNRYYGGSDYAKSERDRKRERYRMLCHR